MLDGATLLCCAGSPLVLFQVSVEKPFSLSCALNILLLHVVLCEILNEREDFFYTESTLYFALFWFVALLNGESAKSTFEVLTTMNSLF